MDYKINLNDIKKVKEFVNLMQAVPEQTILKSGKFAVDAKSIMGVFSLDLSEPLTLTVEFNPDASLQYVKLTSEKILAFEEIQEQLTLNDLIR